MKRSITALAMATALVFNGGIALAQRGHGGGPKTTTTHGQSGATHGQSGATHGQSGTTHGKSGATHGKGATTTTTTHGASGAEHGKKKTTTTTTGTTLTLTPVQQKLQRNTNLADMLQSRLPAGTDLMKAAEDFRNLGQFVAAVNVSNNLGIPFADLKTRMIDEKLSLGQAIQAERSDVNATTEVRRAETDANRIITETERTAKTKKNKGSR